MRFVIIDESTTVGNATQYGGAISPTVLAEMAAALNVFLNRDVATYWGGSYAVRAGSSPQDVQVGEVVCALLDSLPTAPGAVAYHATTGVEVPVVFLARTQCNSILAGSDSVSSALSHELAETAGDPACNLWADDGQGSEFAHELCDCVQEFGYSISAVSVSDFALPAFFAPGSNGPWNFGAINGGPALTSALQTGAGGYQLKRTSGTGETQVTGMIAPHRMAKKTHWSSRTSRRGLRVSP
jgi:hypothetical protein